MILTTQVKVITYQKKSFKNLKGETVPFTSVEFVDSKFNKFTASVPADAVDKIGIELSAEDDLEAVDGVAELEVLPGEKGPKLKLISFKPN